jgi:hypothetical protein
MQAPELTPEVREILRAEAFRALKALPRRGVEIGGFLTGSRGSQLVDQVELVESEHLYGPSYRLSPTDLERFRERLQLIGESPDRQVIAYFRSCTRDECRLEDDDIASICAVLPGVFFFLLLKPFQSGNSTVQIFSGRDEQVVDEFELCMNFATRLPEPAEAAPVAAPTPSPHTPPKVVPINVAPHRLISENPPARSYAWVGFAALAALFVVGGAWTIFAWSGIRPQTPKPQPVASAPSLPSPMPTDDLGLRVENRDGSFRVTWNRSSPALLHASALLEIDDGHARRELQLDQDQLATGSLVYVTKSTDLTFQMQVHGDQGRKLTERVRVLVSKPKSSAERAPAPVRGSVSDRAPEEIRLPTGTGELVVPVVRSWPSATSRAGSEYHPAYPLRRITPEVQASLLTKPAIVKVQIWVDDRGRVTEARELDSDPTAASSVPALAISASRQWTFEPAQSRGHNVPSDYRIVYWFTPHGT